VGVETNDTSDTGSIQLRTTTVGVTTPTAGQSYTASDILQTNPTTIDNPSYLASAGIQIGPGVDLVTKSAGGKALTKKQIDKLILDISSTNKIKAAQFKPKVKPNPNDIKIGEEIIQTYPSLKNLDWKSLVKKGAVLGLSVGALYYIYKLTHEDEPPIPVPPIIEPPIPNPSQYKSCPETLPIAKFCKNETIRKVQGCLGITTDSLFGPKTQAALEAKGVDGTSITQQTVDKVCNNAPLVDPDTEDVDGQDPNNM
jgi:hypothetical protein